MKTVIVGGQPGVAPYAKMVDRLRRAGCDIVQEIPAKDARHHAQLHADAELAILITSWCGRAGLDYYSKALKRTPVKVIRSTHQWSKLLPHISGLQLNPHPPTPFKTPAPETVMGMAYTDRPAPKAKPTADEALKEAILALVIVMKEQRIETINIDRDGNVSLERVVVKSDSFSLGV
jgi:hypothetical protein